MGKKKENLEKEIIFANRIFLIKCEGKKSISVCGNFFGFIWKYEEKIKKLMDSCNIPEQIILNFKKGDKSLDAVYYVQSKEISKHLIVIDIYTNQLTIFNEKERRKEFIQSFIHELIHHEYKDEIKTTFMTKKFLQEKLRIK